MYHNAQVWMFFFDVKYMTIKAVAKLDWCRRSGASDYYIFGYIEFHLPCHGPM